MWCGLEPGQTDASGAILNGGVYGNEKTSTPESIEARWFRYAFVDFDTLRYSTQASTQGLTTLSVPKLWLIYLMGKRKRGI